MFTTRTRSQMMLLAGFSLALAACFEDDDSTGTLVVPFELGNGRDCDDFDVEHVRGELDDGKYVDEVRCEIGVVKFEDVPKGKYDVRLFGLDNDDVAVMDSLEEDDLEMEVLGDGTTVIAGDAVKLTSAPANLYIRWTFGFGTCKSAGVDQFEVEVWRGDGSDLLMDSELDCDEVSDDDENYHLVPDPKREFAGDEVGEVTITPVDKHDDEIGDPVEFEFDAPGAGRDVKLSLLCNEEGCVGWNGHDKTFEH
ncbi:MAG TPA: hypothetical protein VJR89_08400 [Polyangiales bacterium]|nr:hypothetical protein [Polyangiales bacterium]